MPATQHKKVLIFDLDETLIHCIENIDEEPYDIPITVDSGGDKIHAGINIRPSAYECL